MAFIIYFFYPEKKMAAKTQIDSLIVYKSKHEMLAYSSGHLIKTYRISMGKNTKGHKEFEGDEKTPEGIYFINSKNTNTKYYKNLSISYPNQTDAKNAKRLSKSPGGNIKIHGLRNGLGFIGKYQRWYDWTAGCIALTNDEMDEIYPAIPIGTKIKIYP